MDRTFKKPYLFHWTRSECHDLSNLYSGYIVFK